MKRNELNAEMARNEYSIKELARAINISESTLKKRLAMRTEFTRKELNKIRRVLNLSNDRFIDIFFGTEVSEKTQQDKSSKK